MNTKYSIEKKEIFCDFLNKNIMMTTKFSCTPNNKTPIERKCSELENCNNKKYCIYGKI